MHHLLEYMGSPFKDIGFIINPWPTQYNLLEIGILGSVWRQNSFENTSKNFEYVMYCVTNWPIIYKEVYVDKLIYFVYIHILYNSSIEVILKYIIKIRI
jgi:hypothetical protein